MQKENSLEIVKILLFKFILSENLIIPITLYNLLNLRC